MIIAFFVPFVLVLMVVMVIADQAHRNDPS